MQKLVLIIACLTCSALLCEAQTTGTIKVRKPSANSEQALYGTWQEAGCKVTLGGVLITRLRNITTLTFTPENNMTSSMPNGTEVDISSGRWKRTNNGQMLEISQRRVNKRPAGDQNMNIYNVTPTELVFYIAGAEEATCKYIVYNKIAPPATPAK